MTDSLQPSRTALLLARRAGVSESELTQAVKDIVYEWGPHVDEAIRDQLGPAYDSEVRRLGIEAMNSNNKGRFVPTDLDPVTPADVAPVSQQLNSAQERKTMKETLMSSARIAAEAAVHGAKVASATEITSALVRQIAEATNAPQSVLDWLATEHGAAIGASMLSSALIVLSESGYLPTDIARGAGSAARLVIEGSSAKIVGPVIAAAMPHLSKLAAIGTAANVASSVLEGDSAPRAIAGEPVHEPRSTSVSAHEEVKY